MTRFTNISNPELSELIETWVKGQRDRAIMKRRLIDCIKLEPLAEEFDLSVQRVSKIVSENIKILSKKVTE